MVIILVPICLCGLSYSLMMLQGQAFVMQVTAAEFFGCRSELFKAIERDYHEAFKRSSCPKPDQGFFLCEQMLDSLHRLLRRIVELDTLPDENDWETLQQ